MNTSFSDLPENAFFYKGGRAGILLIHGLTGTPTEMKFLGKSLAQRGFTVYGMQLAGHGTTEEDLIRSSWHDWARSVEQGYAMLRREVDTVFVGGLSMGALLAIHLAALHPRDIAGIGIYSATVIYDGWSIPWVGRHAWVLPWFMRFGIGRGKRFMEAPPYGIKDEKLRRRIVNSMYAGDAGAAGLPGNPWPSLAEFYKLVRTVKRELKGVRTPALILHATEDDVATVKRNADYLARNLAGPVRQVLLDDCYHMITIDQQRHLVVDRSAEFFGELAERA